MIENPYGIFTEDIIHVTSEGYGEYLIKTRQSNGGSALTTLLEHELPKGFLKNWQWWRLRTIRYAQEEIQHEFVPNE